MKSHFLKENDVVLSSRWQFEDGRSKGLGTEWDKEVVGKVDPQKRVLCNQSILKEINPEYSLEGLMLKLKLQYFRHLIRRVGLLEKTLMLGKMEGNNNKSS